MQCLIDTSVIIALAQHQLLPEAIKSLGVGRPAIRILKEVRRTIDSFVNRAEISSATYNCADQFIRGLTTITTIVPEEQIILRSARARFQGRMEKIDGGEEIILMHTAGVDDFLILCDDKKCLRVLAGCPECSAIHARIKGRVMCLEQILRVTIKKKGYAWVQSKIAEFPIEHTTIQDAFANGKSDFPEDKCCEWLKHFEDKLQGECNGLLSSC